MLEVDVDALNSPFYLFQKHKFATIRIVSTLLLKIMACLFEKLIYGRFLQTTFFSSLPFIWLEQTSEREIT